MAGWEESAETTRLHSTPRVAVTELFHQHYRRLVGLAALMVDDRETAEEVVQDAFEALYRHWPRLRDPHAAVAYLNRSVVNGARSKVRRRVTARAFRPPEAGSSRRRSPVGWPPAGGTTSWPRCTCCPDGSARWWCCGTSWTSPRSRSRTGSVSARAR